MLKAIFTLILALSVIGCTNGVPEIETLFEASSPADILVSSNGGFGTTSTNTSVTMILDIENRGDGSATDFHLWEFANPEFNFEGGDFPGTSGTCGNVIASQEQCTVVLSFISSLSGSFAETITIEYSSDSGVQTFEWGISAEALDPSPLSHFVVSGIADPHTVGTTQSFTVQAIDTNTLVKSDYEGTIQFFSDASATLPPDYTFTLGDAGTYNYVPGSFSYSVPGDYSFRVEEVGDPTKNGQQDDITVTSLPLSTFSVILTDANPSTDLTQNVTVTAWDTGSNIKSDYVGTITFSSDGIFDAMPDYTFSVGDLGTAVIPGVNFNNTGSFFFRAEDVSNPAQNGQEPVVNVTPGAVSSFEVTGVNDPTTTDALESLTVEAKDADSNTVTNYTGTVTFMSDDGGAILPSNYTFTLPDAGVASFPSSIDFGNTGNFFIRAEDTINASINGLQSAIEVRPGALSGFTVGGISSPSPQGQLLSVLVTALDGDANTKTDYTGTITFSSDNGGSTLPANYTFLSGDNGAKLFPSGIQFGSSGPSFYVRAEDVSNPALQGQQSSIIVESLASLSYIVSGADQDINWRDVQYPFSNTVTYHVTNSGDIDATVTNMVLTGGDPEITINGVASTCDDTPTITSGNFCTLVLEFESPGETPSARTNQARITYNDGLNVGVTQDHDLVATGRAETVSVNPRFPGSGANWNDYVNNPHPDNWQQNIYDLAMPDSACSQLDSDGAFGCFNGGELKIINTNIPSSNLCANYTLHDYMGFLDWDCDENGANLRFFSKQLQYPSLSNIVNYNGLGFWDLSVNTAYDSISFGVSGQDLNSRDLAFNDDGTKAYMIGVTNDSVHSYTLSTAYDLTSASHMAASDFNYAAQDGTGNSVTFNETGSKMYIAGDINNAIYEYNLGIDWDPSTATSNYTFYVTSQDNQPTSVRFNNIGNKMYVLGRQADRVYQYHLSDPWNLSTAVYETRFFSVGAQTTFPTSIDFSVDGKKMFAMDSTSKFIYQYNLSTPWEIVTAVYSSLNFIDGANLITPMGLRFHPDGQKFFIVDSGFNSIRRFSSYDFALPGWMSSKVKIEHNGSGTIVARSNLSPWWNEGANPVFVYRSDPGAIVSTGTREVHVFDGTFDFEQFRFAHDRVSVVSTYGSAIGYNGATSNCNRLSVIATGSNECLILANGRNYLWVEMEFDDSTTVDAVINIANSFYSTVFPRVVKAASNGWGVNLDGLSNSKIIDGYIGNIAGTGPKGVRIVNSDNNLFRNLSVANIAGEGILLDTANGNVFQNIKTNNNDDNGIMLDTANSNIFSQILATNNGRAGISLMTASNFNTFSHITAANNGGGGSNHAGVFIGPSSTTNLFKQMITANNNGSGIDNKTSTSGDNVYAQIVSAHNQDYGVDIQNAPGIEVYGNLVAGNNGFSDCRVAGANPDKGLDNVTCTSTGTEGSSTYSTVTTSTAATFFPSRDLTSSFVGMVSVDDTENPHDSLGQAAFSTLIDWFSFDFGARAYGPDENALWTDNNNRRFCSLTNCRIWDWSLDNSDTVLVDRSADLSSTNDTFISASACPSHVAGANFITIPSASRDVLYDAVEAPGDFFGNDNGVCESNELCLYSPNFGYYQGEDPGGAGECNFTNGTVTGVRLFGPTSNGQ